jgi:hypothetical protein
MKFVHSAFTSDTTRKIMIGAGKKIQECTNISWFILIQILIMLYELKFRTNPKLNRTPGKEG